MRRGDVVIVRGKGDFGKTRPAVVIQSDAHGLELNSVTVCPMSTHLVERGRLRLDVSPSTANGLRSPSQIMIDKIQTYMKDKVVGPIGSLDLELMTQVVDVALRSFLDLRVNGLEPLFPAASKR